MSAAFCLLKLQPVCVAPELWFPDNGHESSAECPERSASFLLQNTAEPFAREPLDAGETFSRPASAVAHVHHHAATPPANRRIESARPMRDVPIESPASEVQPLFQVPAPEILGIADTSNAYVREPT